VAVVGPSLCLKTSAPYWFDLVSYRTRMIVAAVCMAAAFGLVGITQTLGLQLLGVAMASVQNSIGEASMLALASRYSLDTISEPNDGGDVLFRSESNDSKSGRQGSSSSKDKNINKNASQPGAATLTAWSSGTGFAGVFGYGWITVLHVWVGLSFCATILLAWSLVIAWLVVFFYLLPAPPPVSDTPKLSKSGKRVVATEDVSVESPLSPESESPDGGFDANGNPLSLPSYNSPPGNLYALASAHSDGVVDTHVRSYAGDDAANENAVPVKLKMNFKERLAFVASLWPFMVIQNDREYK